MSEEIENEELVEEEVEEQEEEEFQDDDTNDLQSELEAKEKKIKELEDLIARKKKENKKPEAPKPVTNSELSQKELYTLIKNNVHEDDIDEVVEYAQLKKIDVKEALKSSVIKAILKDKEEVRKTAEVSNTGNTRTGSSSKDADTLVAKARKGELPQSDADMKKIFNRIVGLDK